jgi:hypothetical protein
MLQQGRKKMNIFVVSVLRKGMGELGIGELRNKIAAGPRNK